MQGCYRHIKKIFQQLEVSFYIFRSRININLLSPEYTRALVYGKCVLLQNQIVSNRLKSPEMIYKDIGR